MTHASGLQLDGQCLYERQKDLRAQQGYLPAPQIVAAPLHVPENIGSVLRLADAAGSSGVIFLGNTPVDDTRLQKTARKCESLVAWQVTSLEHFLNACDSLRPLIALEITSRSQNLFSTILPRTCTFVIGNERHGIPTALLTACDYAIHIPMYGVNGSMNVTHALGIALFEWRRQQLADRAPPNAISLPSNNPM